MCNVQLATLFLFPFAVVPPRGTYTDTQFWVSTGRRRVRATHDLYSRCSCVVICFYSVFVVTHIPSAWRAARPRLLCSREVSWRRKQEGDEKQMGAKRFVRIGWSAVRARLMRRWSSNDLLPQQGVCHKLLDGALRHQVRGVTQANKRSSHLLHPGRRVSRRPGSRRIPLLAVVVCRDSSEREW